MPDIDELASKFELIPAGTSWPTDPQSVADLGMDLGVRLLGIVGDTRRSLDDRGRDVRLALAHTFTLSGKPEHAQLALALQTIAGVAITAAVLSDRIHMLGVGHD